MLSELSALREGGMEFEVVSDVDGESAERPRLAKVRATALAEFDRRLLAAVSEGFHQEPFLSVTDWASQHRYLTGAESGRYNPNRCPYQRAIQDAFNDPEVREVTWMSAERVGKSTVGANVLGYIIALAALALSRLKIDDCEIQRIEAGNVGNPEREENARPPKWGAHKMAVSGIPEIGGVTEFAADPPHRPRRTGFGAVPGNGFSWR